jgi:hypothetical protein
LIWDLLEAPEWALEAPAPAPDASRAGREDRRPITRIDPSGAGTEHTMEPKHSNIRGLVRGGIHHPTEEIRDRRTHATPALSELRSRVIHRSAPLAAVMLLASLAAVGCGKHSLDQSTTPTGGGEVSAAQAPGSQAVVASLSTPDTSGAERGVRTPGQTLSADALPPEVDAAPGDSVVTPGAVVEISALASPDVVDMGLSDGVGREQPFAYDSTMKVWRVFYRVPMRNSGDRVGLAVTATNQGGHWRRVWVFLNLQQ